MKELSVKPEKSERYYYNKTSFLYLFRKSIYLRDIKVSFSMYTHFLCILYVFLHRLVIHILLFL